MPIGAAIGGAVVAGGATVASGAMGAKAQKKAANQAADTSLAVADKNNALYREIYGENKALLSPFSNNGLLASNALTDLLLGTHTFNPTPAASGASATPATTGTPAHTGTGALAGFQTTPGDTRTPVVNRVGTGGFDRQDLAYNPGMGPGYINRDGLPIALYGSRGGGPGGALVTAHPPQATGTPAPGQPPAATGTPAPSALSAWDQFRQGTNYQWRFNEGMRGVTGNYATRGALDSGAAEKAKITFGQNFASNELSNYMNLLSNQQAMGLSAASAVAGVGQGYAGNVAAQNTNAANAAANAALAGGQATAGIYGAIGQGVGQLGGALFQYGMGQMTPAASFAPSGGSPNYGAINSLPPVYQPQGGWGSF